MKTDKLYYGAAYYDEYMPTSRVEEDMALMKAAGMNVIRIGESTWSTWEPREGEFDFTSLHRMLKGSQQAGISVIVGTPTYAIPPWMAAKYPDILADTHDGPSRYGHRQNMDITSPDYLRHCEIIIRRMMEEVQGYPHVMGFQLDNETHHYDTCGPRAQALFKEHLKKKFGTVEAMNKAFGFAYWSNSLGSWDDLPDVRGTINGSYAAEYQVFLRQLVADFLLWQRKIVDEYRRPDQFVTHNFDFEWFGYGYGLQPDCDQDLAGAAVTVAGCDIYHPTQGDLTGAEISVLGSIARGIKGGDNFFVLETQAQGPMGRLPYPGQLRLQAFAQLANGANMVEYWHWHSIHNGIECYWKGVLSHDLTPGATYREAATIGADFARLGDKLKNLRPHNKAVMILSHRSLTGIREAATYGGVTCGVTYNDMVRWLHDALYHLNVGCDMVWDSCRDFSGYDLVIAPCLYSAPDSLIQALEEYVAQGGSLLAGPRSFFTDEYLAIRHDLQPHGLTKVFGMHYSEFTPPMDVPGVKEWMELLIPDENTKVLGNYDHYAYRQYAFATLNGWKKGKAAYIGAMLEEQPLEKLLEELLPQLGVQPGACRWPLVVKEGTNDQGRTIRYLFNYSAQDRTLAAQQDGTELLTGTGYAAGQEIPLAPWGVAILES